MQRAAGWCEAARKKSPTRLGVLRGNPVIPWAVIQSQICLALAAAARVKCLAAFGGADIWNRPVVRSGNSRYRNISAYRQQFLRYELEWYHGKRPFRL